MVYDELRFDSPLRPRRSRKNERKAAVSSLSKSEAALSLPDALAHEIYNPLCAAMLQVAALKAEGHDVDALDCALQRLYAVGAELRLPQRLQSVTTPHLELKQAFGIVLELLGAYGFRVDLALPTAMIQLSSLPLCHFLHCVLVEHLESGTRGQVSASGRRKDGRIAVLVSSATRSNRVRANLLALTLSDAAATDGDASPLSAVRLGQSLGLRCTVNDTEARVETRFELPVAIGANATQRANS